MVGRAAVGNPFLFRELRAMRAGESCPAPTPEERYRTAARQLALAVSEKGEHTAVLEARKHLGEYLRGLHGAAAARSRIFRAEDAETLLAVLRETLGIAQENES